MTIRAFYNGEFLDTMTANDVFISEAEDMFMKASICNIYKWI